LSGRAVVSEEEEVDVIFTEGKRVSQYSDFLPGTSSNRVGVVAYAQNTSSSLEITLTDENCNGPDTLLQEQLALPRIFDAWINVTVEEENGRSVTLSLRRSNTPIFTTEEQNNMGLTEEIFNLDHGEKAVLSYKLLNPNENGAKAVLYMPGRNDAFCHPHVLDLYASKGYDFWTLDLRRCGRAARYLDDPYFGHTSTDFDLYKEEFDLALAFMREQREYTEIQLHGHSTGALAALNYALLVGDEPFDG
jgi:hypothetical protein